MKIKQIEHHQIDQIEALWNELKQHHQQRTIDYSQYYLESTFDKRKTELLSKDKLAIFLAEDKGKEFGFCVVSKNGSQGEVDSLFVKPECRNCNVGQSLMAAGMEWLRHLNPTNIKLSVGQGNEDVLSFYEKLGFKKRAILMEYFE